MESLTAAGVDLHNLWISTRAQMLLPYHRTLDVLEESARGKDTIGTTKRGIGPAYADKSARAGLRMGDLLQPEWLETRLDNALRTINRKLEILGGAPARRRGRRAGHDRGHVAALRGDLGLEEPGRRSGVHQLPHQR